MENWCRHLTDAGTFSTSTAPSLAQVNDWLAFGQSDVMVQLIRYGYGTEVPSNPYGVAFLEKMNCLRTCMNVEMTYPITESGKPNHRMMMFEKQWEEGIEALESRQLTGIGLTPSASGNLSENLVITGTSASRKLSREAEEDRVAGKFKRNFGQTNRLPPSYFDPNV